MSAEKGTSKADTLVKVVLVFFISLLSFSVGTFVGKQVSDSDHRRMALEGEYKGDRQVASTDEKDADKISEKEVENLTEEFVNKEKVAAGNSEDAKEEAPVAEKAEKAEANGYKTFKREKVADAKKGEVVAKADTEEKAQVNEAKEVKKEEKKPAKAAAMHDETHKVAEKVAKSEAPSDGAKEERKPASTLPSVASSAVGKYTVQVAAFAAEGEAKSRAAELKEKGWNAFYFPADVKGHTWYRVSVGLFSNSKSADEFRSQFMKEANTKSAIVQKVVQ
jgi:cell division protein FtsN